MSVASHPFFYMILHQYEVAKGLEYLKKFFGNIPANISSSDLDTLLASKFKTDLNYVYIDQYSIKIHVWAVSDSTVNIEVYHLGYILNSYICDLHCDLKQPSKKKKNAKSL